VLRPGGGAIKRKGRAHTTQRLLVEAIIRLGRDSSIEDSDHGLLIWIEFLMIVFGSIAVFLLELPKI
jgi:hypothetical protein